MQRYKPKVKDESTEYLVYYPIPCTYLPTNRMGIKGVVCISIDVGIINFAIRSERRFSNGTSKCLWIEKVSFDEKETGKASINPTTISNLHKFLIDRWNFFIEADLVIIERQLSVNLKSTAIMYMVISYLMSRIGGTDGLKKDIVISDINPKCKGEYLGAPRGITKPQLKEWAIEVALKLCDLKGDDFSKKWIEYHRGASKTKADDLSDTICQLEAFIAMTAGPLTPGLEVGPRPRRR